MKQKLIITTSEQNQSFEDELKRFGELRQISTLAPIYSLTTDNKFISQIKSIKGIIVEENSQGHLQPVHI